ncbi:hypothetical protein C4580_05075 [Candidatus Woesearchaeota archaeon]|nr:MAG: hypothetical protein C4580_05075 [Candidatus Woesearchaeota archaeon]
MAKVKRRLSGAEEFDIMKMVLDKFLWLGTGLLGFGIYRSLAVDVQDGLWYILAGALVMILFAWFIISEFERIR